MLKRDNSKTRKKTYELPALAVGDVLLVGKFKNRKATITGFSTDENNQPVAQTDMAARASLGLATTWIPTPMISRP